MTRSARLHFVAYFGLCFALWLVLVGARMDSLIVGVPAVFFAAMTTVWLAGRRPVRLKFTQAIPFAVFFVKSSILGGVDVAMRALRPSLPIAPGFLQFSMRVEAGTARVFFANSVSLLPGTLSASIRGDQLYVHVLDTSQPNEANLRELETRVGQLFLIQESRQVERD